VSQPQQCWNCGTENPGEARFCLNCGVPLASDRAAGGTPGLTDETRKVVTVLFVDLVASTSLTERLDPEDAREVVGKFYRVVGHAVEPFGGRIANLLGDAVLAIFGLPTTHEDDPERAVRGALAIRDALPGLNEHLQSAHGLTIGVRIGVNTGEVVAASGSTFDRDFLISDAVTTAARLQQTGSPGSIIVGERTHRLTHDAIEYREMPALDVKGKAAPLRTFTALAPRQERVESERLAAPMVGRRGELMMLRSLFDRCREDATVQIATLLGEPGVGKSRLVREFLAAVREGVPETLTLRGRSTAFGEQIGYHALVDILRAQAGLMDTDPPQVIGSKLREWVRRTLPSSEDLHSGLALTFGSNDGDFPTPEARRRALLESWRILLVELSTQRPVIAVLEDLHWADEGIFDLIRMLVDGPADGAVLVLCIGRPELLEHHPGWGQGWRNSLVIDLKPLRTAETEELVASLGGARLPDDLRRVVTQRADGNPLFAEELVRMLTEGGNGGPSRHPGDPIPETVQAVLTARIDRLPADQRRTLQAAAVVGKTFWPGATAVLTGTTVDQALGAVQDLVGRALVVSRPTSTIAGEPEFAFRHILTRDVAYHLLPRAQRQRAHAQAAQWLETTLGERVEESIEILAEHLRLAGDHGRAADYLHRAATKARRQYANTNALRLFDEALEASQRAGLAPQVLAELHLGRGEVHHLLAHYATALADFESGREYARRAGHQALEAALENRVGLIHHRELRVDDAERHFESAATLAREAGDRVTLARSLIDLATVAWDRARLDPGDPRLTEAIALMREESDQSGMARALNLLGMANFAVGDVSRGFAALEDALSAARQAGDRSREATSISYMAVLSFWGGSPSRGAEYAQAARALAEQIGDTRRAVFSIVFEFQAYAISGKWGDAIRLIEEHLPRVAEVAKVEMYFVELALGEIYQELGDLDRARRHFRAGLNLEVVNAAYQWNALVCALYLARLDGDQARLDAALDRMLQPPTGDFLAVEVMAILPFGLELIEAGRGADLRAYLETRRDAYTRFRVPIADAILALLDAHLALLDNDRKSAEALVDQAILLSRKSEYIYPLSRALERKWEWFHDEGARDELRALARRIAAGLPEDLCRTFMESPRVARLGPL
jgi:predicted ATPase/class 3 adenylate cyclase